MSKIVIIILIITVHSIRGFIMIIFTKIKTFRWGLNLRILYFLNNWNGFWIRIYYSFTFLIQFINLILTYNFFSFVLTRYWLINIKWRFYFIRIFLIIQEFFEIILLMTFHLRNVAWLYQTILSYFRFLIESFLTWILIMIGIDIFNLKKLSLLNCAPLRFCLNFL